MKDIVIQSEAELLEALRPVLLEIEIPSFRLEISRTGEPVADVLAELNLDGHTFGFAVEVKLEATAVTLAQLAKRSHDPVLPPLLATVRLPESLARKCRAYGVSHIDLNGRIWIRAQGLLIDRCARSPSVRYRLADPEVDFFSVKSSRLARVLLSHPDRAWRQADLAEVTRLSQGLVSRLLKHAGKLGWVEGRRGDWHLSDRDAVLDAWEKADTWGKRVTIRQYSTYETDLAALARRVLDHAVGEIAFTQWFAANLRFPYTEPPLVSVYRRHLPTAEEQEALGLREVSDGGKLWILAPRDGGVFQTVQHVEGFPLVSDAQIYLDLLPVGLRGPDQAKALRQWEGFCRS